MRRSVFVMVGVAIVYAAGLCAYFGGRGLHGVDDVLVAGAAAEVAFDAVPDLRFGGVRIALEDLFRGHDHAGSAKSALRAVLVPEGFLHGVEFAVDGESFDGEHLAPVGLDGKHGATFDRLAVHMDGAGAAERSLTTDVRAGESGDIAEIVNEEQARLHRVGVFLPVDSQVYGSFHGSIPRGYRR